MEQYKINLHLLEGCNYKCKHCFAKFDSRKLLKFNEWKQIIDNCLSSSINIEGFNLAGGEPLLHPDLQKIAAYIKSKNLFCSVITNGILIDEKWIKTNAQYYDMIGFSIDSFKPITLVNLGRKTSKCEYVSKERFLNICKLIKKYNPNCKIKVNTVINKLNKDEIMYDMINQAEIDRWKIIKMRPFKNQIFSNLDLNISDFEFENFLKNNNKGKHIIKEATVRASYIIIDANGFLIDNSEGLTHKVVIDCKKDKFLDGFKNLEFDKELYFSRYENKNEIKPLIAI